MFKILRQPYPSNLVQFDLPNIKASSVAGISVFFILVLLRPFGLDTFPVIILLRASTIFAFVTFFGVNFNLAIFKYLNKLNSKLEENWTVGAEVATQVWILFFIGTLNSLADHFLLRHPISLNIFFTWLIQTVIVGIFPSLTFVIIRQYRLLKKYSTNAEVLEAKLSIEEPKEVIQMQNDKLINLGEENTDNEILINPTSLIYITAADNYIRAYFYENNSIKNNLLRGTLKGAEEKLTMYNYFYRCHRSYLVNLNYIRHISGNATGYKLHLEGVNDLIPVSRNLNNEIIEKINSRIESSLIKGA